MRTLCWILIVVSASGCASSRSPTITKAIDEPKRMEGAILTHVPVGTPIDDAQRFMERECFTCARRMNSDNQELFKDNEGRTYLDCNRYDGMIVYRVWHVTIAYQDGKVVEVSAGTYLLGP